MKGKITDIEFREKIASNYMEINKLKKLTKLLRRWIIFILFITMLLLGVIVYHTLTSISTEQSFVPVEEIPIEEPEYVYVIPEIVVQPTLTCVGLHTREWMFDKLMELYEYSEIVSWEYVQGTEIAAQIHLLEDCINILDASTGAIEGEETVQEMLAKTLSKEIGSLDDEHAYSSPEMERAAVAWCILNRVDIKETAEADLAGAIVMVTKKPKAFAYNYYKEIFPGMMDIAADVLYRYMQDDYLGLSVGRVLPKEYLYFNALGDGWHNVFRIGYETDSEKWKWTLPDPYIKPQEVNDEY